MEDRQHKGLCYNCDEKYVWGYCCREQKLFHIDVSTNPDMEEVALEELLVEYINEQPMPVPDMVELATSIEEAILYMLDQVFLLHRLSKSRASLNTISW